MLKNDYKDHVRGFWAIDDGYNKAGWHAGVYFDVPLLKNISAEAGLMLLKRGHRVIVDNPNGVGYILHERNHYFELPLLMKYKWKHMIFQTGLSPSYWIGRKFQVEREDIGWEMAYYGFDGSVGSFTRFNLALSLGVGYEIPWVAGTTVMLGFHQQAWVEKSGHLPVYPLSGSNYFSFTTRVNLAGAADLKRDSLGIYWKLRTGTEFQSAYARELGSGYFPGAHPFSFKGGILAGKMWNQWSIETGLLYARRKKLFGNLYRIPNGWSPLRAVMDHGVELQRDLLEIPLNLKYFFNPSFYLHGGLSSQMELDTKVKVYQFGEMNLDLWDQNRRKHLLMTVNGGAGYKLPVIFGHPVYIEIVIQQALNKLEANYKWDMGYRPLVAGLNLDIEF